MQPFEGQISAFQFAENKVLVACEDRLFVHELPARGGMDIDSEITLIEEIEISGKPLS
jgi:hypothetical protein